MQAPLRICKHRSECEESITLLTPCPSVLLGRLSTFCVWEKKLFLNPLFVLPAFYFLSLDLYAKTLAFRLYCLCRVSSALPEVLHLDLAAPDRPFHRHCLFRLQAQQVCVCVCVCV